jgi:serine/threonine protein kinase
MLVMTESGVRVVGGRYLLTELIAAGDDQEVWLAGDQGTNGRRVVKLLRGQFATDSSRQQFIQTADRLAELAHPGIVTTFAGGIEDDATCWLAMAWVDGRSLDQPEPALSLPDRLAIIGQVALAVAALHTAGITHGAISRSNVLVDNEVARVIGLDLSASMTIADDLHSLRQLAVETVGTETTVDGARPSEVEKFLAWLVRPGSDTASGAPADAAEIGRVALALASSLRSGTTVAVVPNQVATGRIDSTPAGDARVAERHRLRNRLLLVAAIVVIGGGVLLRFIGEGGGQVTVPSVLNLPVSAATLQLTSAGLKSHEQLEVNPNSNGSGGTVQSQSPSAGERVKAGSTVTIVVSESSR